MTTDLHSAGLLALQPIRVGQHADQAGHAFDELQHDLRAKLGGLLTDVQHIGGTAVPHLLARPIADVLLLTNSLEQFDRSRSLLEQLGYTGGEDGGRSGQRLFHRSQHNTLRVQLYVYESGDQMALRHLLLRDYLRSHRADAQGYSELKAALATRHLTNPAAYAAGKRPRLQRLLDRATGRR